MTRDDELALVHRAAQGDDSAFEKLVAEHQRFVYNTALKLTGNPSDALDVSQDTFLKAWRNLSSFRGESRFSVWLYRLCYNASVDFLRKNRGDLPLTIPDSDGEESEAEPADTAPLPEQELERKDLQAAVREAVMSLDEDKRQVIIMRDFSDMSYGDIAAALNIEEGTVKSRLFRARAALADILKRNGTFDSPPQSKKQKGGRRNGKL